MNRKMTPVLLSIALAVGLITYISERSVPLANTTSSTRTARVLDIEQSDIIEVRMRRDFWNSFVLRRNQDGTWQLTEPSSEPADGDAVRGLLNVIENLPILMSIDLPSDDSERHRQYGLWEPSMELTVSTLSGNRTLVFGVPTPDGQGTYCAEAGHDRVFATSAAAFKTLAADLAAYRTDRSAATSQQAAGLLIEDLTVGSGETLRAGQTAAVHYTGRLVDGTEFDSSARHGRPFTVKLGAGQVIRGWEQGLLNMRVGGKRRLTIPPELGYGERGHPPAIPPNATLIFEIDLVSSRMDAN